jgi:hypothetical protein
LLHGAQCEDLISGAVALAFARQRFRRLSADGTKVYPGAKPQPIHADQVETAMAFLKELRKTKTPTVGSGTLKHHAEDWGRENGLSNYISRGALISAAVGLGYSVTAYQIGVAQRDLAAIVASTMAQRRERIALRDSVSLGIDCR